MISWLGTLIKLKQEEGENAMYGHVVADYYFNLDSFHVNNEMINMLKIDGSIHVPC